MVGRRPRARGATRWAGAAGLGAVGPAYTDTVMAAYLNQRKLSIFGGTNEIQKNLIARMAGL